MEGKHITVLLHETVDALEIKFQSIESKKGFIACGNCSGVKPNQLQVNAPQTVVDKPSNNIKINEGAGPCFLANAPKIGKSEAITKSKP